MDPDQVLVTVGGGALIVAVLLFFFGPRRGPGARQGTGGADPDPARRPGHEV